MYRSFGKINLHLEVVGRRDDGYHELRTVFQTIDAHDLVEVELAECQIQLEVEGDVPSGPENLAHRAASSFLGIWAKGCGAVIRLEKRLPVGGGLGGGSSNAATVLMALRELVGKPATELELLPLARELGADVPYFLTGGTAYGVGRGDEVSAIPEVPKVDIWLVIPPVQISTAEIFGSLGELTPSTGTSSIGTLLEQGGWISLSRLELRNDLQPLVLRRYRIVQNVFDVFSRFSIGPVRLSGSGATLFSQAGSQTAETRLKAALPAGTRVLRTQSLSREEVTRLRVVE